jgi:hypothetical protein
MGHRTSPHVPYDDSFYITELVFDLKEPFAHETPYIETLVYAHV